MPEIIPYALPKPEFRINQKHPMHLTQTDAVVPLRFGRDFLVANEKQMAPVFVVNRLKRTVNRFHPALSQLASIEATTLT